MHIYIYIYNETLCVYIHTYNDRYATEVFKQQIRDGQRITFKPACVKRTSSNGSYEAGALRDTYLQFQRNA